MKRIALIVLAAAALAAGCKKEEAPVLSTNCTALEFDCEASSGEVVTISTNKNWTATTTADWIVIQPSGGTSTDKYLTIGVKANSNPEKRFDTVVITAESITASIKVTQDGIEPSLELSESELSYTAAGDTKEIILSSNVAWTATVSGADWLTVSPASGDVTVEGTVKVTAAENATADARTGVITFSNGYLSETVVVNQEAKELTKTITLQFVTDLTKDPADANTSMWPFEYPAKSTLGVSTSTESKFGEYMNVDKDPDQIVTVKCGLGDYEFNIICGWWIGIGSKQGLRFGNWADSASGPKGKATTACCLTFPPIEGMRLCSVTMDNGAATTAYPYIVRTDKEDLTEGFAHAWTKGFTAGAVHTWSIDNGELQYTADNTSYMLYFSNNDLINIRCLTLVYEYHD